MPIVASDIKNRLSGGSSNSNVNASLGGVKSSVEIVDATLHNLFDIISSVEGLTGDTEYRCYYIHNGHATLTMQNVRAYISANTPDTDTSVEIGLGTSAVAGTEQTIANESTAPSGVTFSTAAGIGNALTIPNMAPGESKAIWVKRIVSASAAAYNADSVVLGTACDTAA